VIERDLVWVTFSPIHGLGAFARRNIAARVPILGYIGEPISKEESVKRCKAGNPCIFCLNLTQDLDGNVPLNPSRFLNHSCAPDCEAVCEEGQIWIVTLRDVATGEELTFNYNYDLEDYRKHPCRCGAPECVGFMVGEAFFEHVRRQKSLAQE